MKRFWGLILAAFFLLTYTLNAQKLIVVDLSKQEAYAYENGKMVMSGWISSGMKEHPTPTGVYYILEKQRFHISNQWPKPNGGAKMPYMMRLTWSGVAMHLGYTPNYPASHGCIRLKNGFAQRLYKWANVGTKVVIKGKAPRYVVRRVKKRKRVYIAKKKRIKVKREIKNRKIAKAKINSKVKTLKRKTPKKYLAMAKKYKRYSKKRRGVKLIPTYIEEIKRVYICKKSSPLDILETIPVKKKCRYVYVKYRKKVYKRVYIS
ncbi:MAG: L,D-transpeptidase family protein [Epsilonproteobacteria bacterium]|nr:L,D-transpeptidase family protein [Campylobacterota bacterium]